MRAFALALTLLVAALCGACAEDLAPRGGDKDATRGDTTETGKVAFSAGGDGVTVAQVDASDAEAWVFVDLDTHTEVDPTESTDRWDLAFQRFHVQLHPAASVALLDGVDFAAVTAAPADGYLTDQPDAPDDEDDVPEYAFAQDGGWYAYDPATHRLSPNPRVHVVRTPEGGAFKVEMLGYYDAAGTSGFPSFRFAAVDAPTTDADQLVVDASDAAKWVYVAVEGGIVTVAAPAASEDWDLAFNRTQIRTNSGTSGPGLGGGRAAPSGASWGSLTASPTVGFVTDAVTPLPGPPGAGEVSSNPALSSWYDYDVTTHQVSPKVNPWLVRTADGGYAALVIDAYDGGVYTLRLRGLERAVSTERATLDASDGEAWVYFDLGLGTEVAALDAETSAAWDVAFSRTRVRTNGGTSGPGMGAAVDTQQADFDAVTEVPTGGFEADAMLSLPDPPGAGEASSNPVLGAWYEEDPVSHAVSPRATVFVVRTADGHYAKLAITGWDDGIFDLTWAYAGPGHLGF